MVLKVVYTRPPPGGYPIEMGFTCKSLRRLEIKMIYLFWLVVKPHFPTENVFQGGIDKNVGFSGQVHYRDISCSIDRWPHGRSRISVRP